MRAQVGELDGVPSPQASEGYQQMARLSLSLSRLTLGVTELWALSTRTGATGASTSPHASPDVSSQLCF